MGAGPRARGHRGPRPADRPADDRVFGGAWQRARDALSGGAREPRGDPGARASGEVSGRFAGHSVSGDAGDRLDGAAEGFRHPPGRCRDPRHVSHPLALRGADHQGRRGGPVADAERQAAERAAPRGDAAAGTAPRRRRGNDLPRRRRPLAPPAGLADGGGRGATLGGARRRDARDRGLVAAGCDGRCHHGRADSRSDVRLRHARDRGCDDRGGHGAGSLAGPPHGARLLSVSRLRQAPRRTARGRPGGTRLSAGWPVCRERPRSAGGGGGAGLRGSGGRGRVDRDRTAAFRGGAARGRCRPGADESSVRRTSAAAPCQRVVSPPGRLAGGPVRRLAGRNPRRRHARGDAPRPSPRVPHPLDERPDPLPAARTHAPRTGDTLPTIQTFPRDGKPDPTPTLRPSSSPSSSSL